MIAIIKQRKIWFTVSGILVAASIVVLAFWGLRFGIDFTGGSLLELDFLVERPTNDALITVLQPLELGSVTVQRTGEQGVILRFEQADEETHQAIINTLKESFRQEISGGEGIILEIKVLEEKRFDSIGPTIGQELQRKTIWAIGIVIAAIILYIAWAFRKVSQPVASWKYGLIAVVALVHDIAITLGIFAILGQLYQIEINAAFVAALLTILGYSVNDTIVVFDRTRENLVRSIGKEFETVVEDSVNQVLTRSINTSVTTIIVLFAILLFGGATVRDFVLALIIGIGIGTYSSIFVASPLLVTWEKLRRRST